ncbi:MAG: NAD(P)H-dependent oxidoreductase [Bacteroidota bacterium]|nr:NAD(P)H-dependent oxidoreductase [Bacteroidota bacterium]
MYNLKIIIASTRPGRKGISIGNWFNEIAKKDAAFNVEVLDLAKINLPFLDEPNHPRLQQYTKEHTKEWSKSIDAADAFVFIIPEYNYSVPPTLLNAIDFLYKEWNYKPVGIVSYGGVSAGTRSAQMCKQVITAAKMMPLAEGVNLPFFAKHIDENGKFVPDPEADKSVETLLQELLKWTEVLKTMRSK